MADAAEQGQGPAPDRRVRVLVRAGGKAVLASRLTREGRDWPYASLVLTTPDPAGRPLLFLSDLAEHSRALAAEPAASLLYDGTAGHEDPLTGARASLLGTVEALPPGAETEALLDRFVARHPGAAGYRGFADFKLYRMAPAAAHLVAGFGDIHWLGAEALRPEGADPALDARHDDVVGHMNEDHADAVAAIAAGALGRAAEHGEDWRLIQLDSEALMLRQGQRELWVSWPKPVSNAEDARRGLIHLTRLGRERAPPTSRSEK